MARMVCGAILWRARFGCKRLEDEGAVLACSIYAALNPFRADMCDQPAEYPHTSFAYRVQGEMLRRQRELGMVEGDPADDPDSWLAALFVDGRAAAYDATMQPGPDGRPALTPQSNPFPSPRVSNKGYLTVDWPDYERLVRWTAEHLRCRADATQPLLVPEPLGALLRERGDCSRDVARHDPELRASVPLLRGFGQESGRGREAEGATVGAGCAGMLGPVPWPSTGRAGRCHGRVGGRS